MDQDGTWHGGRPQPRRLVRWGPSPLPKKGAELPPQFWENFYCAQTAGLITMLLGTEVGLIPGDFVFDGDPALSPKRGQNPPVFGPFLLSPNGFMNQDGTWYGGRPQPRRLCVRWGPSYPQNRGHAHHQPVFGPCFLWLNWMKTPLGTEVDLGAGHIVLDEVPALCERDKAAPPHLFGPCLLWPRSPISAIAELLSS